MAKSSKSKQSRLGRIVETFGVFLRLGCISFGGPTAHLGYFQDELVQRRGWIRSAVYADIVALCQFLPGPSSSQVALVLGYIRSGLFGGILGWLAFTAPSTILMIGFAYGIHVFDTGGTGWLLGLKAAAVAVVAQAIWMMTRRLCPDWPRILLALIGAVVLIIFHKAWLQPVIIVAGACFGLAWFRPESHSHQEEESEESFHHKPFLPRPVAAAILVLFALLLGISLLWHGGGMLENTFARFYRTGSLVFGGGHVVLPLLETETVSSGLVPHDVFLAGYGTAQALPGPLFTFAGFLGASMSSSYPQWFMGLWCLAAILLPSLLLIVGILPFWAGVMENVQAQAALKGTNAAVVGLLIAAFYDPVWQDGVTSIQTFALALVAFILLQFCKIPNWAVVLICAVTGGWFL